jgi:peptide/nickel transport system substrate-binding protein
MHMRMGPRLAIAGLVLGAAACATSREHGAATTAGSGGTIVSSIRGEPRSFNRYVARDVTTEVVTLLIHAPLVRVDRVSQQLVPELAEDWTLLPDGLTYRIRLRRGVRFSDGKPLSVDDVLFSFNALYDERTSSPLAERARIHGEPLRVAADGANSVLVHFPGPFGPGLRLIAGIPIFPRHKLEAALANRTFAQAWGAATPPSELVGLGPFVLREYTPGQRLLFERNPHYWHRDTIASARPADRVVLEVISDQNAEQLAMESGRLDFTQSEVRPADYAALKRAADTGRIALKDLGVGQDGDLLWFNLAPSKADPRRRWLQSVELRRAISHAIDREAFVHAVYLGAATPAYGVVSPANTMWYERTDPDPYDIAAAKRLLASVGLVDRDGDGRLDDGRGNAARFTLITQRGNSALERGAAVIRDSLARVGITVDVVALEVGALVARFTRGEYEAVYFRLLTTDTDPAMNLDFWLSSGSAHVWNPSQAAPATVWERRTDGVMLEMASERDAGRRRALFAEVQRIMAHEVPALCFAFPRVWVAMNARVRHATPAAVRPPILWNPAVVGVASDGP